MKTFLLRTSASLNPTPPRRRISAINTIPRNDIRSAMIEGPRTSVVVTAVTIAERIVAATVAAIAVVAAAGDVAADAVVADARRVLRVDAISLRQSTPLLRAAIRSVPTILAATTVATIAGTTIATSAAAEDSNAGASNAVGNLVVLIVDPARVVLRSRVAAPKSLLSCRASRSPSIAASLSLLLQRRRPNLRSTSASLK
jgi:hypothetical protein